MTDPPDPQHWRLIPVAEYGIPAAPPSQRLRRGFRSWWRRLHPETASPAEIPLHPLAEARLDRLVPPFPVEAQVAALLEAFAESGERLLLLTPPDGSWAAALTRVVELLAERGTVELVSPLERPLGGLPEQARSLLVGRGGVAVAQLGHWFLRHQDGLAACRELLSRLAEHPSPMLVGCDTWSWLFLTRALAAPAFLPDPRVPAALDAAGVESWLAVPEGIRQRADGAAPTQVYFQSLAAEGLGLPGVIRDLWRECLRSGETENADSEIGGGGLWLRSPEQGIVPVGALPDQAPVLLYSLLLHGGLAHADLQRVLPLSPSALAGLLDASRRAGIVDREADVWRIEMRAYPEVRRLLIREGYLVGVV